MSNFLVHRPGCHYALRMPSGNGRYTEKSLGTHDRSEAEIIARRDYGIETSNHMARVKARRDARSRRLRVTTAWTAEYAPGLHTLPDGRSVFATERELHVIGTDGTVIEKRDNGTWTAGLEGERLSLHTLARAYKEASGGPFGEVEPAAVLVRKDDDSAILTAFLDFKHVTGYPRKEAEREWQRVQAFTVKPARRWTWNDVRAYVQQAHGETASYASLKKRLCRLCSAINHAKRTGTLPPEYINPFEGVIREEDIRAEKLDKLELDDADLEKCRANLHTLSKPYQLMFRLLTCTGMRLGEAVALNGELRDKKTGIRYCHVGTKTDASARNVPFPQHILRHLPKKIEGRLFPGITFNSASKTLNAFLHASGVSELDEQGRERKTVHSLRHRAQTLLRDAECPQDVRYALLGHAGGKAAVNRVAEEYGSEAFRVLKKYIDKVDGI